MVQLVFAPSIQVIDSNGAPYSGAKLYTYVTTTSTPLTVYQDSAFGTPHDFPVVADTSGRFAPIYTNKSILKVVIKTSAGVTIQSIDPVTFSIGAGIDDSATTVVMMTTATTSLTLGIANQNFTIQHVDNDRTMVIAGGTSGLGGRTTYYGQSHATQANDIEHRGSAGTAVYQWDDSATRHIFQAGGTGMVLVGQSSTDTPGSSNNTAGISLNGSATGRGYFSCATVPGVFNVTSDATLLSLNSGGTSQGAISVAGATVTYGAFFGSHWSQLADGSRPDIPRGTIVESIDQMCEWPGEGPEERLPRFKISDMPGSKAVYGVFAWWDYPDDAFITNDAYIGSLGAFVIRVAPDELIRRGDYIESAGNGCGRVQDDDILRASTVAKITSAFPVETYPDGSRLYPCTLHCG